MKATRKLVAVKSFIGNAVGTVKRGIGRVMPWLVFAGFAAAMLFDPGRNTLGVAGAAFVVTLGLASVSFSYGRTLEEGSAVRDEVIFAGERLVNGAVLFLFASVLKYSSHDIPRYLKGLAEVLPEAQRTVDVSTLFGMNLFGLMFAALAFLIFLAGLVYAQMGISILGAVVAHRAKRRPGHDDYFGSAKDIERRVAELEEAEKRMGASPGPGTERTALPGGCCPR